ncbi:hypothetical protein EDD11_008737 [Mortierella claussenii]|nr:hypothetical protein EDD11_008737 [Mortierella claussenii]
MINKNLRGWMKRLDINSDTGVDYIHSVYGGDTTAAAAARAIGTAAPSRSKILPSSRRQAKMERAWKKATPPSLPSSLSKYGHSLLNGTPNNSGTNVIDGGDGKGKGPRAAEEQGGGNGGKSGRRSGRGRRSRRTKTVDGQHSGSRSGGSKDDGGTEVYSNVASKGRRPGLKRSVNESDQEAESGDYEYHYQYLYPIQTPQAYQQYRYQYRPPPVPQYQSQLFHQQLQQQQQQSPPQQQQHPLQQHQKQENETRMRSSMVKKSLLQGIQSHSLQPTQLTHLTLLRYEFLMGEFLEMMHLLPSLEILDLDIISLLPSSLHPHCLPCQCSRPDFQQNMKPSSNSKLALSQEYYRSDQQQGGMAMTASGFHTSSIQDSGEDEDDSRMMVDEEEGTAFSRQSSGEGGNGSEPAQWDYRSESQQSQSQQEPPFSEDSGSSQDASAADSCSSCFQRLRSQQQFPTVRTLTFRGTILVPELLAFFPNLEALSLEETVPNSSRQQTAHQQEHQQEQMYNHSDNSNNSRYHSGSNNNFGRSSFYTDSDSDSLLNAAAGVSPAGASPTKGIRRISKSRLSVMITDLAQYLLDDCPRLTRLVLNEPLLVDDNHQMQELQRIGRPQQLTILVRAIPQLTQFVAHFRVVAKCPGLVDTLLKYHHLHLVSFQILEDIQQQQQPSKDVQLQQQLQNWHQHHQHEQHQQYCHHATHCSSRHDLPPPYVSVLFSMPLSSSSASALLTTKPMPNDFNSRKPFPSSSFHEQQLQPLPLSQLQPQAAHPLQQPSLPQLQRQQQYQQQYHQQQQYQHQQQQSLLLQQTLQLQQQQQRQVSILLQLRKSCFRILEYCPQLEIFESKIPLPLQNLIASVPHWACRATLAVLRLEIQELTVDGGLDPEEEVVMQMFVKSLFKASSTSRSASLSPGSQSSQQSGLDGDSSSATCSAESLFRFSNSPSPPYPSSDPSAFDSASTGLVGSGSGSGKPITTGLGATAFSSSGDSSSLQESGSASSSSTFSQEDPKRPQQQHHRQKHLNVSKSTVPHYPHHRPQLKQQQQNSNGSGSDASSLSSTSSAVFASSSGSIPPISSPSQPTVIEQPSTEIVHQLKQREDGIVMMDNDSGDSGGGGRGGGRESSSDQSSNASDGYSLRPSHHPHYHSQHYNHSNHLSKHNHHHLHHQHHPYHHGHALSHSHHHRLPLPPPPPPPLSFTKGTTDMPMAGKNNSHISPVSGSSSDTQTEATLFLKFQGMGHLPQQREQPPPQHIDAVDRLVALQFLIEHQLIYLPKLDQFFLGNRMYKIPTRT